MYSSKRSRRGYRTRKTRQYEGFLEGGKVREGGHVSEFARVKSLDLKLRHCFLSRERERTTWLRCVRVYIYIATTLAVSLDSLDLRIVFVLH